MLEGCPSVLQVLRLNAHYGVSIPRFHDLRKMRLQAPGLNAGKSGGYRLVYCAQEMDEAIYVVFLETYFKGDQEDLTSTEYKTLSAEANAILAQPKLYDWD